MRQDGCAAAGSESMRGGPAPGDPQSSRQSGIGPKVPRSYQFDRRTVIYGFASRDVRAGAAASATTGLTGAPCSMAVTARARPVAPMYWLFASGSAKVRQKCSSIFDCHQCARESRRHLLYTRRCQRYRHGTGRNAPAVEGPVATPSRFLMATAADGAAHGSRLKRVRRAESVASPRHCPHRPACAIARCVGR